MVKTLHALGLLGALVGAACSGSAGSAGSPTAPSSATPASPAPPTAPAPPAGRTLTFTPDSTSPAAEGISVEVASRGHEDGKISLAVTAHGLENRDNLRGSPGIHGIWGRVEWDAALLTLDGFGPGAFLQQGGVEPGCCAAGEAPIEHRDGAFAFSVQRRPETAQVTGSGEIVLFRLRPRDGVTSGSTRIEFAVIQPPLFPERIMIRPGPLYRVPQNLYGGQVTIR